MLKLFRRYWPEVSSPMVHFWELFFMCLLAFWYVGFIVPFLINSSSTFAVFFGLFSVVVVACVTVVLIISFIISLEKEKRPDA